MLIKEIDNTFKGWCKLKEEIEGMVSQRELAKKLETLNPGIGMENDNVNVVNGEEPKTMTFEEVLQGNKEYQKEFVINKIREFDKDCFIFVDITY